MQQII